MRFRIGLSLLLLAVVCARGEDAKLYLQLGHSGDVTSGDVTSLALSPSGRYLITGSTDNTARLWDVATGRELRHFDAEFGVSAVAFAPDGQVIATGDYGGLRFWDLASGREIKRFKGYVRGSVAFSPDGGSVFAGGRIFTVATGEEIRGLGVGDVTSVAFSPDGRSVLVGAGAAQLWDFATGREIRRFGIYVTSVAFSPDGRIALTGGYDGNARLWDVATGREIRRFESDGADATSVAFSPDGRLVLTGEGNFPFAVRLWDSATGREIRQFHSEGSAAAVAFSPDGNYVFAGGNAKSVQLWDIATGREIRRFEGRSWPVHSVAYSTDGRSLLIGAEWDSATRLWDLGTGRQIRRFEEPPVHLALAFSRDGRTVLTGSNNATPARLWDTATGREIRGLGFEGMGGVWSVAFSPDGHFALTGSNATARLWDVATGREIRRFEDHGAGWVSSVAFSPDGHSVLIGSQSGATVWKVDTGDPILRLPTDWVNSVAFSPDGRSILAGSLGGTVWLWDVETGREIRRFEDHHGQVWSVAFSPDGHSVLTGGDDRTARLWDIDSGREIRHFDGHSAAVRSAAFSPDGRFVLTGSLDSTTRLWNAATGAMLATLVDFRNGGWAVVDPEGRYDASNPDETDGLYWRVGPYATIGLSQLRRSFYTPRLLARIVQGDPLPPVKGLNQIAYLPPTVSATIGRAGSNPTLEVKLTDLNGAGLGRITIRVNGRPFRAHRISQTRSPVADILKYRMSDVRFAEGENKISVSVASADNLIESEPSTAVWNQGSESRGASRPVVRESGAGCDGRFYGIFVGTGTFPFAPNLHLRYPESDAKALSEAVRLGAESLCGKDRVELITLTTDADATHQPTKDNIHRAFETVAAKSTRNDLLFVYFSGHGAAPANDPHSYFYLTRDARQVNVDIADKLRESTTVSGSELVQWLTNPNLPDKQVLILDTCAAGAASTQLAALSTRARSTADDLKKAVDNWNLDTGTYILMGSATDRSSFESDRFRHGLLTYALLRGMKGDALLDGSRLEAGHWFDSAIPAVQKYAAMIGKEQTPEKAVPSAAGGIPVGFLPEALRNQIVVPEPALEILKLTICFEESSGDALRDPIKIASLIRSELRATTDSGARGAAATVTYDDNNTESSPGALTPQVRYHLEGSALRVRIALVQGETPFASMTLSLSTNDLQSAAKQIAEAMIKLATRQP